MERTEEGGNFSIEQRESSWLKERKGRQVKYDEFAIKFGRRVAVVSIFHQDTTKRSDRSIRNNKLLQGSSYNDDGE